MACQLVGTGKCPHKDKVSPQVHLCQNTDKHKLSQEVLCVSFQCGDHMCEAGVRRKREEVFVCTHTHTVSDTHFNIWTVDV